ncbi:calmodulin-binding transcription activator 2 [Ricinus communis]|uniref:calmodulin-binding transcription activator 2 n=1 Tax=Ricinus communis TaxID=3988 RepID=UPI0007721A2F|nr:calmodulin-binding transcription activator 2 [Ricinus communis]|eukprot:XP_015574793.1 calmodulin-binding transcription activator 2 [Ricinus communis]
MADRGSYGLGPRLDIQQLFLEAQHRWLRPAEICEILRNYQKFHISSEPPSRPPSGSLFLFDRKVLRYFRKDGHNWRKKKDGKTVREAHEKLKVGSVDVLHCYYAHGEENESFQRRSYWMLEQDLMHIVFVHYLEVKGNRTNNSPSNSLIASSNKEPSGNTDSTSPTSTLTSFCEDADSADSQQVNSGHHSYLESPLMQSSPVIGKMNAGALSSHFLHPGSGPISYVHGDRPGNNGSSITEAQSLKSWEEVLEQCTRGDKNAPSHLSTTSTQSDATGIGRSMTLSEFFAGGNAPKDDFGSLQMESHWQIPFESSLIDPELAYDLDTRLLDQRTHNVDFPTTLEEFFSGPIHQNEELVHNNHHMLLTHADQQLLMHTKSENDMSVEENGKYAFILKQPLLDGEEGLKKVDSFSRWVTRELGEVDDLHMKSSSGIPWSTVECGTVVDESSLSPSLSQDQLFSIIDFSPKWGYADSKTEVHISGTFLKSQHEVTKYNWSCMFGELEVPAEVLADGILCCYAPPHSVASVPFYVTCSNRLACSEVREFDYQSGSAEDVDVLDVYGGDAHDMYLHLRLERLLSLRSSSPSCLFDGAREKHNLVEKLILLKEEDEGCQVAETTSERQLSQDEIRNKFLQKGMQEKLYSWLLHTVAECGKGPSMLDDDGQGMLHLAAALGYDWAIKPTMTAGVSINFRDVNGWTALHWAAFYGREQTVAALVSLGADTRVLTDPSPEFPLGSTPADLASGNGHKGISGFLAESSLTSYLHLLTLNDSVEGGAPEGSGMTAVQTISERMATPVKDGDVPNVLSLKDSLTAIRNATQAANRIYQVFRMQSFQRKQLTEYSDDEIGMLDERALALIAAKTPKPLHSDGVVNAAAIQIQKKYRGWKKRKEFLIIRQRIVKIQAHIRGHQVRKQYRTIIWSVGILEKVILRWRRKGSGLRGFRREALPIPKESNVQCENPKEDDYDFLKEGRKQNEVRQQKALTRVKSMYHCSEGQAQYRRLLNYFEKFRETKENEMILSSPNEMAYGENLIDIDSLLDDDTFMSIAFE